MGVPTLNSPDGLMKPLARLLGVGSWVSVGLIAAGMVMEALSLHAPVDGARVVSAGIGLLLALPCLGVLTAAIGFCLRREFDFALVALTVLAITVVSIVFGVHAA